MSKSLPCGNFKFITDENELKQLIEGMPSWTEESEEWPTKGWYLDVDLEIPVEKMADCNPFVPGPVRKNVTFNDLSPSAQFIHKEIYGATAKHYSQTKLVCSYEKKTNYITYFLTLKKYVELGKYLYNFLLFMNSVTHHSNQNNRLQNHKNQYSCGI